MKLNGIPLISYAERADEVAFTLECSLAEAVALDGQDLSATGDDGKAVKVWAGYAAASVGVAGEYAQARFRRKLDDATADAIRAAEASIEALGSRLDEAVAGIGDEIAAASDPQVAALARIAAPMMAASLTDEQALSVSGLWPGWEAGVEYSQGQVVSHLGSLYRVNLAHSSQAQWEPGAEGSESLYAAITLSDDGIEVWKAPSGAHDAYALGTRVRYPDASGAVYASRRDGNTSEPTKDEWWELVG